LTTLKTQASVHPSLLIHLYCDAFVKAHPPYNNVLSLCFDKAFLAPGKKIPDYWEPSKKLLNNPTEFLESLLKYDKENIPDSVIKKIEPYIHMEDFTPEAISKVSKACTSICMWARYVYITVSTPQFCLWHVFFGYTAK
jgi:hypothetical protein